MQVLDIESNSTVANEIGPLKYVSELLDRPMNQVVNWFILIFIFVFDPLAIVLLIASNKAFDILRENTKENIYGEKIPIKEDWDEAEKRMNIIGQNGNDGIHYEQETNEQKETKTIHRS